MAVDEGNKKQTETVNGSTKSSEDNYSTTKLQAALIVTSSSGLYFLFGFQFIAFSAYYVMMTQYFDVSKATAGWIGSVQLGLGCLLGVFFAPLIQRYGSHPQVALWSLLMFISLILSAYAVNIYTMYLTYGVLLGTALGISLLCATVEIQQRFHQRRVLAFVALSSSANAGNIIGGYLTGLLIETFGWRGTMLVNAALMLHAVACSLLYSIATRRKPKRFSITESNEQTDTTVNNNKNNCLTGNFALLWQDLNLVLFCIARMLAAVVGTSIMAHMSLRCINSGMSLIQAMKIITYVNTMYLLSRVLTVALNVRHCINDILACGTSAIISGLVLTMSCFSSDYVILIISYTINPLLWGHCCTLLLSILVDICGKEQIAHKQAIVVTADGIGILIGTPLVGFIFDVTQSYDVAYMFIAITSIVSGAIIIVIFCRNARKQRFMSVEEKLKIPS